MPPLWSGRHSELVPSKLFKTDCMANKKSLEKRLLLTHPVRTRVTRAVYERLENIRHSSNCQTLGEVARKILSNEQIRCFYTDVSLNAPMEELTSIRKELKAIGININQQTRYFHTSGSDAERSFYVLKTTDLYSKVDEHVKTLLTIVSKIAEQWLQKS